MRPHLSRLRFSSLLSILSLVLAACGAVPTSDWCYTFTLPNGNVSSLPGWSGISNAGGGNDIYLQFSLSRFRPEYIQVFVTNLGSSRVIYLDGSGWGFNPNLQAITVPAGNSTAWVAAGATGNSGYFFAENTGTNITVDAIKFYGNGANPFPSNECAATPSPTPSPTAAAGLSVDVGLFLGQINESSNFWMSALAVVLGVTIAAAVLVGLGAVIVRSLGSRGD